MTTATPLDVDRLTIDAVRAGALRERPVTVLGFARSGIALARFLVDAGARVTVYDGRPAAELSDATRQLEGRVVRLLAGPEIDPARLHYFRIWQHVRNASASNPDRSSIP